MIPQNVRLDEFYHIIKKKMHFKLKIGDPHMRVRPPPSTPNNNIHTDIVVLTQNVLLIHCGLISHQNEQNKKKIAKIAS